MIFDLKQYGNNTAFLLEDQSEVTYYELDQKVEYFSKCFNKGRGLLLLEADNSLNTMVAYLAALRSNCPVMLTEPPADGRSLRSNEVFHFLYRYSGLDDSLDVSEGFSETEIDPNLALLLSTSGSTGASKYVCLSYGNLRSNALSIIEYLALSEEDRAPTNLPFYYSYGFSVVNSHLMAGGAIFLTKMSIMDKRFWEYFDHFRCTSFAGVPRTYAILDRFGFQTSERENLRYSTQAGGKLSKELVVKFAEKAEKENWKFFVMYGQTEASPRMSYLPPDLVIKYPECIGIPIPNGNFTLEDMNGKAIKEPDVEGELVYTGPNVMMGYALSDQDLGKLCNDTKLRTGDMACCKSSGLYYITGRKSRFIKLYGIRVSLDQVEDYLLSLGFNAVCGGQDEVLNILVAEVLDENKVRREVAHWLGVPLMSVKIYQTDRLPIKSNGKPDIQKASAIISRNIADARRN